MTPLPKRSTSVLYIDNDLDDRELVEEALREIDSRIEFLAVEEYASLDKQLKELTHGPDLVIVGINQPHITEIENLVSCQNHASLRGLPFCVFSSTEVLSVVDQIYNLGARSFMIKPSDFKSLKSLLKSIVTYNWTENAQLKREDFLITGQLAPVAISVLMIDDDPEDRAILFNALIELYPLLPCESAFDGEDAISCLKDKRFVPDVIFLDLNMPRMNGIECLKALRRMKALEHSKIIVFTVSADPHDMEITNALGANHFVTKPPTHDSLINVLSELLAA